MAAPDTTPDLSVVHADRGERPLAGAPRTGVQAARPASGRPKRASRPPWWLLVVVAVIGLALFVHQLQRADRLEERVASLSDELAATGAELALAQGQVAAHQAHLELVRSGLGDLGARVAGLQALADLDPLAPPVLDEAAPFAIDGLETDVSATASEASEGATATPGADAGQLTDAEGYFWRAEGTAPAADLDRASGSDADAERRAIVGDAVGTPFSTPANP